MGEKTAIAWTDHTFNIAWGCFKWSPGCDHCYADSFAKRTGHKVWGPPATTPRRVFGDKHWREPIEWNDQAAAEGLRQAPDGSPRPHLVFCSSMCDVFEDHPTIRAELLKLWPLIRATPFLHWQLLTKREDRIASSLPDDWGAGYPNVWLGVSIENDAYTFRADALRQVPAVVRFISYEPALGPLPSLNLAGIDWLIAGGETGGKFRRLEHAWAEDAGARCASSGAAFFFKQDSALHPGRGVDALGAVRQAFPVPRRLAA